VTAVQLAALIAASIIGLAVIGLLIRIVILDQRALAAHQVRMAGLEVPVTILWGSARGDH
jgi:hypothetical protein